MWPYCILLSSDVVIRKLGAQIYSPVNLCRSLSTCHFNPHFDRASQQCTSPRLFIMSPPARPVTIVTLSIFDELWSGPIQNTLHQHTPDNIPQTSHDLSAHITSIVDICKTTNAWQTHAKGFGTLCYLGDYLVRSISPEIRLKLVVEGGVGRLIGESMGNISDHMERMVWCTDFDDFLDEGGLMAIIEVLAWDMGKLGVGGV